jgi:3-oxoacyl-(acyl-carrier-protein) synthase
VDAVNCHARSTVTGDNSEAHCLHSLWSCGEAVKSLEKFRQMGPEDIVEYFNSPLPARQPILHGQKGHLGHAVAAAGAIESVFCFLTLQHQLVPHIKNLKNPVDPDLNYAFKNESWDTKYILKNGFVFGGTNSSLLFKKYE